MVKWGRWPHFPCYLVVAWCSCAGHLCRDRAFKSQSGFPINITDRNVGWEGSLEVIQSDLFLAVSLELVQPSPITRLLSLLSQMVDVFFFICVLKTINAEGCTAHLGALFQCGSATFTKSCCLCTCCPVLCQLSLLRAGWQPWFRNIPACGSRLLLDHRTLSSALTACVQLP